MELILMSLLTALGILVGIYVGSTIGEGGSNKEAYTTGYEDGFIAGAAEATKDFPTTLDGKFFSTEAAIRSMSSKEGDS